MTLSFARKQISWLQQSGRDPLARGSALEATLLHLAGAYSALLAEIAADPHFPEGLDPAANNAITMAGGGDSFVPAALGQCAELERSDSWLSQMLAAVQALEVVQVLEQPAPVREGLIASAVDTAGRLSETEVCSWASELQSLVEGLRDAQVEY